MVDMHFATAENRRGKERKKKVTTAAKNIMFASATQGGHKKEISIT